MSYNIDSIEVLKIDAFMYAKDIVKLADELEEVCEDNLLCNLYVSAVKALASKGTKSKVAKKTQRQQQPAEEPAAAESPDEVWPPPPQSSTGGLRR